MSRVALVSGGTRGIGAAISEALIKAGYRVAATYAGNEAAAKAFREKAGAAVYRWDASDFEACSAGIREVEAAIGPVDILVNNAGIVRDSSLHKMTKAQWDAVIATDLSALFNMCRPVIEGMRARKFGRIINIFSINGQKGQFGQTNYSAAKAGNLGFTRALALESAPFGYHGERYLPGLYSYRDAGRRRSGGDGQEHSSPHSHGPAGRARGYSARGGVSCSRRRELHHRFDAVDQRRTIYGLSEEIKDDEL
jgi:acetoacetyl-CoA reductase